MKKSIIFIFASLFLLLNVSFILAEETCTDLIKKINNLVEQKNYCSVDSDCMITTEIALLCGRYALVNKNANLIDAKEAINGYNSSLCGVLSCTYVEIPKPENVKCVSGKCISNGCQPTKCDDGTMTECKESNGICSCSSCPEIIVKPVCGNGICESGEGEICTCADIKIECKKGKECKVPPCKCEVICPEDCKPREGIYVNLNEKFKLMVYQSAKIRENANDILKITFKDLIAYKCKETELSVSESKTIKAKIKLATENVVSETSTSSIESSGSNPGSGGVSGPSSTTTEPISILKCIGAGPKALLRIDLVKEKEKTKNMILNLELGEKKQVGEFTIYFLGYDYASRTGTFLVDRETFNCPVGCKCDQNGKFIECPTEVCKSGYTLCPDGKCREKCESINPEDCKYGCLYEGKCFPMGVRTNGTYCSDNSVMSFQKGSDENCENNFECKSNVCVSGKCVSEGLIQKILNWFRKIFGG